MQGMAGTMPGVWQVHLNGRCPLWGGVFPLGGWWSMTSARSNWTYEVMQKELEVPPLSMGGRGLQTQLLTFS